MTHGEIWIKYLKENTNGHGVSKLHTHSDGFAHEIIRIIIQMHRYIAYRVWQESTYKSHEYSGSWPMMACSDELFSHQNSEINSPSRFIQRCISSRVGDTSNRESVAGLIINHQPMFIPIDDTYWAQQEYPEVLINIDTTDDSILISLGDSLEFDEYHSYLRLVIEKTNTDLMPELSKHKTTIEGESIRYHLKSMLTSELWRFREASNPLSAARYAADKGFIGNLAKRTLVRG